MADDTTNTTSDTTDTSTDDTTTTDDTNLGDAGQRALAEERRARREAAKEAKTLRDELAALKTATQSDSEKAIAAAKAEARTEALKGVNGRIVKAEVKALAAGKFADPGDAALYLGDLEEFVDTDGEVDTKKLGREIDRVLKEKPYLRATARVAGGGDGGPRGEAAGGDDWNSAFRRAASRG